MALGGRELILGVTGSIAAYKAVYLLRELVRLGARVTVVRTAHAEQFVGDLTWRTLSGRPVLADLFDPQSGEAVEHVALAERADAVVVAPATANLLAKAAHGIADDFLTTVLLAARGPVLMVPAMDGGMWDHAAVSANVATLRCPGRDGARAGRGRARLRAQRQGPPARGGRRSSRRWSDSSRPPATSRASAPRHLGPYARAHRSRSLSLQPLVREDGPRHHHRRAPPGRRRHPDLGPHRAHAPARGHLRPGPDRGGDARSRAPAPSPRRRW